ncbi:MAG: hypothetical protein AB1644_11770 [Candidatus Zixiibacteriota bacterium]
MTKQIARWLGLFLLLVAAAGSAQEVQFGKNKVQYKNFDWSYIQSRHFDIYFYENAYPTAKFAMTVMESAYVDISRELNYKIQRRVPVFIYNSHNDFQQTNIIPDLIPEGVGGFTEVFKSRIVIPFTGSYEDFRHVLHHELTHAVVYDMLYGNMFGSLLSQRRLFNLPLWYAEGYAEYSSRHGWDYFSDMFVRDATVNGYLTPPQYLGGFLAYKQGQAMIKFIADKYGEEKLGEILQKGKIHLTMGRTLKAAIGVDEEELWEAFAKEMKRRYWPEIAQRKEADEIGKQLTHARKDGSYFNEQPVYSPDGDKIAIFTDKSDYTEIVLLSALDGKVLDRLVKGERSGDLESLHSYVSGMSFSPDGRSIAFVAKSGGRDAIMLLDINNKHIYRRKKLNFYNVHSPAWSPDSTKIAFSALDGYKRDLYIFDLATDQIRKLTDDRFDDLDPSWMPNSSALVFASDRPHDGVPGLDHLGQPFDAAKGFRPGDFAYGDYNLFSIDIASSRISAMEVGPGTNRMPMLSPDGKKVAFISNRNGTDNVYVAYLDSSRYFAVTDLLTGARSMSWSPDGQKIALSAFYQGAFDIFVLKDLMPVGDNGVLKSTDFVLGKYNFPKGLAGPPVAVTDSVVKTQPPAIAPVPPDTSASITPPSDSTLLAVTDTSKSDTATTKATADSTTAARTDSLSGKTGIYGDEYVYVSKARKKDPLDSLMQDITSDTNIAKGPMTEPPSFDSIPGALPSGEYEIKKYKVKFTPDYVGGGFSYNTFFGLRGQSYFVFSDYLGNHQIYLATDLVNTIDQSNVQAYYFNNTRRTNFGGGIFHTKNYYLDSYDHLFSDRFYGLQFFVSRPKSMFSRIELIGAQYFIDRKYYDFDDPRSDRSSKVTTFAISYVTDNILWGYTGPINGRRAKVTFSGGVNLFDANDIEFYSTEIDWRKYWHLGKNFSTAIRLAGGASFGKTPKMYFLGGTTNWIGRRTLEAKVYDVENLYFADVVTPLRGQDFYGLSGDRFGLINAEFRFPMIQILAMRFPLPIVISNVNGAIFTDIGAAWTGNHFKGGTSEGGNRLQDIKTGFGFGMRANLFGFVLLRYDLAWSTDFYRVSDKPTYYFSLGADF